MNQAHPVNAAVYYSSSSIYTFTLLTVVRYPRGCGFRSSLIPRRYEKSAEWSFRLGQIHFLYVVGSLVIVFVHPIEVKGNGDAMSGKIVMIGPVVKPIGIVGRIITVIQGNAGLLSVGLLTDGVKF